MSRARRARVSSGRTRVRWLLGVACAVAGCNGANGHDAGYEDTGIDLGVTSDVRVDDALDAAVFVDADAGVDAVDAPPSFDVMLPPGNVDAGVCVPRMPAMPFSAEPTVRPRSTWVLADNEGFDFTAVGDPMGTDQITFYSLRPGGAVALQGVVVTAATGAHITGAAMTPSTEQYLTAFSTTASGTAQVFVQAVQNNAIGIPASLFQISEDSNASEEPQAVNRTGGYLVGWRSTDASGTASLLVSSVNFFVTMRSTPSAVSRPGAQVTTLRMVGSATDALAVAYMDQPASGAASLVLQPLTVTGLASGVPLVVATGTDLTGDFDAVAHGTQVALVWSHTGSAPLSAEIIDLGSGEGGAVSMGPLTTLTSLGVGVTPGIDVDPSGYVVGFRVPRSDGVTATLSLARLGPDLSLRDLSPEVVTHLGGRVAVGYGSATGGAYGLGWTETSGGTTSSWAVVVGCP